MRKDRIPAANIVIAALTLLPSYNAFVPCANDLLLAPTAQAEPTCRTNVPPSAATIALASF